MVARSHDGGRHLGAPAAATGVIHWGLACTGGLACTVPSGRAFYDCFGAALDVKGRFAAVLTRPLAPQGEGRARSRSDFVASLRP